MVEVLDVAHRRVAMVDRCFCGETYPCEICLKNIWIAQHQCGWCDVIVENLEIVVEGFAFCNYLHRHLFFEKYPDYKKSR